MFRVSSFGFRVRTKDNSPESPFDTFFARFISYFRFQARLLLGAIAALGEGTTFAIQVKAALKNGELTPEHLREIAVFLVHYVGYPRGSSLIGPIEKAIAEQAKG